MRILWEGGYKSSCFRSSVCLGKVANDSALSRRVIDCISQTFLNFPKFTEEIIPGDRRNIVRGNIRRSGELVSLPSKDPSKFCFKCYRCPGWSTPPALQYHIGIDVHSQEDVNLIGLAKVGVSKVEVREMTPFGVEVDSLHRQVTCDTGHNNS